MTLPVIPGQFGDTDGLSLSAFLAGQYEAELQMFRASLDGVDGAHFAQAGAGHSAAWHALHVADWLRLTVLEDRTPNYHYLGWEDKPWVAPMQAQPAPLHEDAPRADILARLDTVAAQAVAAIRAMTPDTLLGMAYAPSAPTGERPRLPALGMHLRHVAYHRGQVQLGKKSR